MTQKIIKPLILILFPIIPLISSFAQEKTLTGEDLQNGTYPVPLISYRIFPGQFESDAQFSHFLTFLNEHSDAVDEIALFDEPFPRPAGLPLEDVSRIADRLKKRIAALRQAGIRSVGINVAHTLGHWDVPGMPFLPLPPAVGHDGSRSATCMCPNSPEFRDYIQKKYALMARTGPDFIWVDDDFRAQNHGPTYPCFCSLCLERFGQEKELATLVARLNTPENTSLRREWSEFCALSLEGLAHDIHSAVHDVDPKVELGLMTIGYSNSTYAGYPINRWMVAMGARRGRPGHGFYTDNEPKLLINKAIDVARQVRDYPSEITTIAYELENAPYITLDKSTQTVLNECTLALMMGCNGFALNVLNRYEGTLEDFHPLMRSIARERSQWKTLLESSVGLPLVGLWPADHPMLMANRVVEENGWFFEGANHDIQAPNQLVEMGIPFAADSRQALGTLLSGKLAEAFTTEELRQMLAKSVLLDAFALRVLWARGLDELTGVRPGEDVLVAVTERFTDHPLNSSNAGFVREAYVNPEDRPGTLVPIAKGVSELSHLVRHDGADLGSCFTLYTNELGGRVAVCSYAPWKRIGQGPKRRQVVAVADWLSGGSLPVIIDQTVRVAPFVRQSQDGRVVAVLFNTSLDATGPLTVHLRASPNAVSLVSAEGSQHLFTQENQNETVVEVPSIPPWSTITLVGQ